MRRFRLDGGPPDLGDPALVNLVTTGCQLDGAAFAATVLHLGSRGVLALSRAGAGEDCGAHRPAKRPASRT